MANRRRTKPGEADAATDRAELLTAVQKHMAALREVADGIGTGNPLAAANALKRAVAGLERTVRRIADRAGYDATGGGKETPATDQKAGLR